MNLKLKNLNFAQVIGLTREILFAVEPVPYRF